MKRIIVFILLVVPYFAFSQEITVNKKWIDKDSCWVFTSFNSIGIVGNDTLCESGVFTISLPKSIRFYCETPNKVLFVFPKNQSLLIEKVFNHNSENVTKDTTIHNYDDICLMISRFTNNCGNNRFYKRMNKIVQSKSFINKKRVSSLYMKDGYKILLFNIKRKEYKYFLDMLNSFKVMPTYSSNIYNGKEWIEAHGYDVTDLGNRGVYHAINRFTSIDRFAEKYPWQSPYVHAGNNPVNYVDMNGDSIAVLNLGVGINQHSAMLIQNKKGKWEYFSINGNNVYVSGKFSGGRKFNDISVGSFDSPQQFMDSEYNQSGDKDDKSINSYGFKEAYIIPTTKNQDEKIRDAFIDNSKKEYNLLGNNCSTVVQLSLEAGGLKTYTKTKHTYRVPSNYKLGESSFTVSSSNSRPIIPSVSFKHIIKLNPKGKLINSNKK